MSAKRGYDDAFGVVRMRWELGRPNLERGGIVIVEVWRASTLVEWNQVLKPEISVVARTEVWVKVGEAWQVLGYRGQLTTPEEGEVRRHARLGSRQWRKTISLDGWDR